MTSNSSNETENILAYIGEDLDYWAEMEQRFIKYFPGIFVFKTIPSPIASTLASTFKQIQSMAPKIIFLDLSKESEWPFELATFLKRSKVFSSTCFVALLEKINIQIEHCLSLGLDFVFIKGAEFHDTVNSPVAKAFPEIKSKAPDFFHVTIEKDFDLLSQIRIGFLNSDVIRLETNALFNIGEKILLEHNLPKQIFRDLYLKIHKKEEVGQYYDYDYVYEGKYLPQAPPSPEKIKAKVGTDVQDKALLKVLQSELAYYKEVLATLQEKLSNWIKQQVKKNSEAKKVKVLVLDKDMIFFANHLRPWDQYKCLFRYEVPSTASLKELTKFRPHLIVSVIPNVGEGELGSDEEKALEKKAVLDSMISLGKELTIFTQEMPTYRPYLLFLNFQEITTEEIKKHISYDNVISFCGDLNFEGVVKLAAAIQKKIEQQEDAQKAPYYYISKKNPESYAYAKIPAILKTISESEMTFGVKEKLPFSKFRLFYPETILATLVPIEGKPFLEQNGRFIYRALFHGMGENQKKSIRRELNYLLEYLNNLKKNPPQNEKDKNKEKDKEKEKKDS